MHRSLWLLLLSRMNGRAPALMKARRLDDSRAGWLLIRRSRSIEHSKARFFARFRFVEDSWFKASLLTPESRKGTQKCL